MLNSAYTPDVTNRIRRGAGRVFLPTSPDNTFMAASLAVTHSLLYMARPGSWPGIRDSIGSVVPEGRGRGDSKHSMRKSFIHLIVYIPMFRCLPTTRLSPRYFRASSTWLAHPFSTAGSIRHTEGPRPSYSELRSWELAGVDIQEPIRDALQLTLDGERAAGPATSTPVSAPKRAGAEAPLLDLTPRNASRGWRNGSDPSIMRGLRPCLQRHGPRFHRHRESAGDLEGLSSTPTS